MTVSLIETYMIRIITQLFIPFILSKGLIQALLPIVLRIAILRSQGNISIMTWQQKRCDLQSSSYRIRIATHHYVQDMVAEVLP